METSSVVRATDNHTVEEFSRTASLISPKKRTSPQTLTGTPVKRQLLTPTTESPQKYPSSPAGSRAGLRSGLTPQKSREIPTTPKKTGFPGGTSPSSESKTGSGKPTPEKPALVTTDPKLASPLKVALAKIPDRGGIFRNDSSGSVALPSSPAKSPGKNPPRPDFPASPAATRCGESARRILTPTKRGTLRKFRGPAENGFRFDAAAASSKMGSGETVAEFSAASGTEGRPSASKNGRPPVVIVFEDFECFNGQLLQDMITVCG